MSFPFIFINFQPHFLTLHMLNIFKFSLPDTTQTESIDQSDSIDRAGNSFD